MSRPIVVLFLLFCCTVATAYDLRFFVHIPKTGGTTFRHIFAADCSKTWTFFADSPGKPSDFFFLSGLIKHNNYTCFQGHMSWELVDHIIEEFPQYSIATFLLLRDPKARLISQYYYEQAIYNRSYTPQDFFYANSNVYPLYLGDNATDIIEQQVTYLGITEYYHETLSYLLSVGFIRNFDDVINYSTRKVHQVAPSNEVIELADKYTKEDARLYQVAMQRFSVGELMSVAGSEIYESTLQSLNSIQHDCKNDEEGIGSGRCRQK